MPSNTPNLHLKKLTNRENFSNVILNDNWDSVDRFVGNVNARFLKAPLAEGAFGQVLRTNGDGVMYWDNDASTATIVSQTTAWLAEHIINPDSPPLDRSLTQEDAAAPADLVGDVKTVMTDLVVDYVKHVYPNPRQLFDKSIIPGLTGNNLHTNTSSRAIATNNHCRVYAIEVNGHAGELYTFNLLNSKTFADYSITSMEIYAINVLPADGGTALQRGSSSSSRYRGTLLLGQDSKYIYIDITSEAADVGAACNGAMENTVVRKGDYDTTYYDFSLITDYDTDYKVVSMNQGVENAGKTLKVNYDGTIYLEEVLDASSEIAEVQRNVDDYLLHTEKIITVNPRQLFDKTVLPSIEGNALHTNTSSKEISANSKARIYVIEVNGAAGDGFSYNLLNSKTFADFHISTIEIYAISEYPIVGRYASQRGSSSSANYRGNITLAQDSRYIYLDIAVDNNISGEENITNACNGAMENMVVRKGATYDTTYYEYYEDITIIPHFKVVELDQGIANAGRMLMVGGDGKVTVGKIINPKASDGVGYFPLQSIYVGNNIITQSTSVTVGDGWSGNLTNGLTHTFGTGGDCVINITLEENKRYLMTFTISNEQEGGVHVAFGDQDQVDIYGLSNYKNIGFVSDGVGKITISASATQPTTTLTDFTVRELDENGTRIIMNSDNTNHGNTGSNISGYWNVAIGASNTQCNNVSGSRNVAIGYNSQNKLRQGTRNVAVGTFSMPWITEGDRNIAIGADSLYSGSNSHNEHNRAYDNVAIGYAALHDGELIQRNVAVGVRAMKDGPNDSTENVVVGYQAGNYSHNYNTFVGHRAGYYNKSNYNVALGWSAGADLYVNGIQNIAIGASSGIDNTGGTASAPLVVNNTIAVGHGVKAKGSNQAWFGRSNQTIFLAGKQITFNQDGTVTWTEPA